MKNPMGIMREEWFIRDGFACVPCRIIEPCNPKGVGWCGGNRLLASDLAPATYFKLDALRDNASLRLHVSHLRTRANEGWRDAVASCACHNLNISSEIREACLRYTTQFAETGTERFEAALRARPAQRAAKKNKEKTARARAYQKAKTKAGGTRLTKSRTPAVDGKKYAIGGKWAWASDLPVLNGAPEKR